MILNYNVDSNNPSQIQIELILKLFNSKNFSEAKKEINKQIIKNPNSYILFNILGGVFYEQGQLSQAIENYKKALEIRPNYAEAFNNLGIALYQLNRMDEAIYNYKKAIAIKKDFAIAYNNLAHVLLTFKKPKESLEYYKEAININSNYHEAYNGLGNAYRVLGDKKNSIKNFEIATKINPSYSEPYNNLGIIFSDESMFDEALSSYKKALQINPNDEKYYNNIGNLLSALGKHDEATAAYNQAIKIEPRFARAYSNLLLNLNYKLNFDFKLYLSISKKFRFNCMAKKEKLSFVYKFDKKPKKLKLGLISSDFGNHPGGYFSLSTIRELKKKNFDLIAYSNLDRNDDLSSNFRQLFSKWHSIENRKDVDVVEQILNDGIHILIDMQGHSGSNRLPIFMHKPAPIQATWHYQGSTGIPEIDYAIGNSYLMPHNEESHWIEKIYRLPNVSQCFTPPEFDVPINNLPFIKNKFVTFGSLNKLNKINESVIALWSKVLSSISNSKLVLKTKNLDNKKVREDIMIKFKKNNIKSNQIILLGESKTREELLKIYNNIDISLDTFPFQGYTTSCESIWMGVPVLTLKGNRLLFHSGECVNSNLGMFNWVADNNADYVSKAIEFSSNVKELTKIRKNLRKIALQSPLCDSETFGINFSKMLWEMWSRFDKKNSF
jgi:predicted O-linked N-acetylglucosamine transferase (SPINDLY family)